jgi:hypothetical protein
MTLPPPSSQIAHHGRHNCGIRHTAIITAKPLVTAQIRSGNGTIATRRDGSFRRYTQPFRKCRTLRSKRN